ncbi:GNAT family N-acetyltransferase [Arthrobacter sp. zg-ZUI100]|uniref:GNAT family N-acetyltransferase n=1 Tax=Arthrobacter jiangjiafuii TaxID=2817475 RepID=UPI001AED4081|nr:GNAT family N-acetyltransferase [Arthrobacter jiangjiafuii]MBP3037769.1 GNAT family N-acetyltransferase [Arthrobacter jiangjiafuii]
MELQETPLLNGLFLLRAAERSEVSQIVELLAADAVTAPATAGLPGNLEPYLQAYDAIAADPAHGLVVCVDGDGRVAGTMQLTLLPCLAAGGATRLQIEAVHVRADLRSKGLGAAMMEHAVAVGRQHGAGLMQLTSNGRRESAHRFYQRLGFEASHVGFKLHL